MTHIIDTVPIFEIIEGAGLNPNLMSAIQSVSQSGSLFMSVISHGEITGQIEQITDPTRRRDAQSNYSNLRAFVTDERLLPFNELISLAWANNREIIFANGYTDCTTEELMVFSTAMAYNFQLICHQSDWHQSFPDFPFIYV